MNPRILGLIILLIVPISFSSLARADDKPKVAQIGVDEFDKKRQEKNTIVLDVRTPHEYEEGHIPGAVNIDLHDPQFADKIGKLDKSKTYLVHCAKGYRSATASTKMAGMGFSNLFDFHGGFAAWENAHKPIEKGK